MNRLLLLLLTIALFTGITNAQQQQKGVCAPVPADFFYPKSSQVYVGEPQGVGSLKGRILGPGGSQIRGPVLVEIIREVSDDNRISACFADQNGFFDFGRRKKGRYRLKISMEGWDTSYIQVTLNKSKNKEIFVELRPST